MKTASAAMDVNGKSFDLRLADNETARTFAKLLPLSLPMSELNGNEKYYYYYYYYLDAPLPSNAENIGRIEAGDVMLYGDSCIVVFYESHDTTYAYTRIGKVSDPDALAEAVGTGDAKISFK